MLDLNRIIPPMLADIIKVEPQFSEVVPTFPLGIFTPLTSRPGGVYSGRERLTVVSFQVDVYDTSLERCCGYAVRISERLTERGFNRDGDQSMKEGRLSRRSLSFSAIIDEDTGMIYRRV